MPFINKEEHYKLHFSGLNCWTNSGFNMLPSLREQILLNLPSAGWHGWQLKEIEVQQKQTHTYEPKENNHTYKKSGRQCRTIENGSYTLI